MAADGVVVKVEGLADLLATFKAMPQVLRTKVLRNALAVGARLVRDEAKSKTPVLQRSTSPYRKPGTVRNAIRVRTSKYDKKNGDVGVFVNVKPLKSAQIRAFKAAGGGSGFRNANDPYYWRWLEFGRQARAGQGARARVQRIKLGDKVLRKGVRKRRALTAVGAMAPFKFLAAGADKLPAAFSKIEALWVKWVAQVDATGKVQA